MSATWLSLRNIHLVGREAAEDKILIKLTMKQKDMVYCSPVHTWMVKLLPAEQNNEKITSRRVVTSGGEMGMGWGGGHGVVSDTLTTFEFWCSRQVHEHWFDYYAS